MYLFFILFDKILGIAPKYINIVTNYVKYHKILQKIVFNDFALNHGKIRKKSAFILLFLCVFNGISQPDNFLTNNATHEILLA